MKDRTKETIAVSFILVLVLSSIAGYLIYQEEEAKPPQPDLVPLSRELSDLIEQNLSEIAGMTDERISAIIQETLPDLASTSVTGVVGYSVHLYDVQIQIHRYDRHVPLTSPLLMGEEGTNVNSELYTTASDTIVIPAVKAKITASVRLDPIDDGEKVFTSISISADACDSYLAAASFIDLISSDVSGPGNSLGRDVEYMLNVIARVRAVNGYGWYNREGPSNVLNEGDVELAINVALALRIASITGHVPELLARSIDRSYTYQTYSARMDPTGYRQWGVSEGRNFKNYALAAGYPDSRRDISSMISTALERGMADPADIIARYLYLEKLYTTSAIKPGFNPFDPRGALEEAKLTNARQGFDLNDPSALRTLLSFQTQDGSKIAPLGSGNASIIVPYIDVPEGYLVSAREYKVRGLKPSEWYTDVALNRSGESLVNINYTQARCGGIVPPSKPPDHDFRMLWDLDIAGSFSAEAWVERWFGDSLSKPFIERTVNFSFPARVLAWYDKRPANDNHMFNPKYRTVLLNTSEASGYLIPAEANATEFFEEYTFRSVRGQFSLLSALQRYLVSLGPIAIEDLAKRESIQIASLRTLELSRSWATGLTQDEVSYLVNLLPTYLKNGALIPYLKPIQIDGLDVMLSWSQFSDRLDIKASNPEGSLLISINGLLAPPLSFRSAIIIEGSRIDLDLSRDTFQISHITEQGQLREGSGSPGEPEQALRELALESSWEVRSEFMVLDSGPIGSYPLDPHDMVDVPSETSYCLVMRGTSKEDTQRGIDALRSNTVLGLSSIDAIIPLVLSNSGTWTGFKVQEIRGDMVLMRTLWIKPDRSDVDRLSSDPWIEDLFSSVLLNSAPPTGGPVMTGTQIVMEMTYPVLGRGITFYRHMTASIPGLFAFEPEEQVDTIAWVVSVWSAPNPSW